MTAYLDHNATTPVRPEVLDAMLPWLKGDGCANPSSVYAPGQRARAALERAREQVAALVGASDASEIVFTSGGSEADALAVAGGAQGARDRDDRRRRVVASAIEHDAIRLLRGPLSRRGFEWKEAPCGPDGVVSAEEAAALVGDDTALVSLMHANNETGALQPVAALAAAARARGALVHTDAVQSAGKAPLDVKALGVDLLSLSGHKLNAPKGVGALWIRKGTRLVPVIAGHQEKGRRGGTENTAGAVALGAACALAARELGAAAAHALALRRRLEAGLLAVPGATLNGPQGARLPNTVHVSFDGLDGRHLVVALDLEGICVSSGPACSSGASEPSHVLLAMGVPPARATGSIRVSVGWGTTDAEVDRLLAVLPKAVERLRASGVPA